MGRDKKLKLKTETLFPAARGNGIGSKRIAMRKEEFYFQFLRLGGKPPYSSPSTALSW
jgi:hypothetical protein